MIFDSCQVTVYCPPMQVDTISWQLHRTHKEPMKITIVWPDKGNLVIEPVTIPPTDVHRLAMLSWMVDRCIGNGKDIEGNEFTSNLPLEPTTFGRYSWYFTMIARQMVAPSSLVLKDGTKYKGSVVYPDCPIAIWKSPMEAAAFTCGPFTFTRE